MTGIINPCSGTNRSNNGAYSADSGLDILISVGSPVAACADG